MNQEHYRHFVAESRMQRDRLAPFLSAELLQKIDAFDWIFSENAPRPLEQELATKLRDFVSLMMAACETAIANNGNLSTLIAAKNEVPDLADWLVKISSKADLVDVWTRRLANPAFDLAQYPIFIVSSWRSGSTLLSNVLDTHPNIAVLPEIPLLEPFVSNPFAVISPDLPTLHKNVPPIVAAQIAATNSLGFTHDEFYSAFAKFLIEICSRYAHTRGKKRFVYKEPVNIPALDLIDLLFGYNAKFIWLVRHGLDVVESHLARYQIAGQPDVAVFAREWVSVNQKIADMHELIGARGFKLRYEDLLEQPRERMTELFDFLGERSDEQVLSGIENWGTTSLGGDHKIHGSGGKIKKPKPSGWKLWPPALLRQLSKIVNPMLVRAGYEPVEPDQASDREDTAAGERRAEMSERGRRGL